MFVSIANFLEKNLITMEKEILKTLYAKKDIADVVLLVQEYVNKLGVSIVQEVLEEVDRGIKDLPNRKEKWQIVNRESNTLLTSMGNVTYERTRFKNKKDGCSCLLVDEQFGIKPHARMTEDVVINIVKEATDTSYRKGGMCASISDMYQKYNEKKEQKEYLQDEVIREARRRIGKRGHEYVTNIPMLTSGKNEIYYETIKACRGICG